MLIRYIYCFGAFIIGIILGYTVFYLLYENAKVISALRQNHHECKKLLEEQSEELEEYKAQNEILKKGVKKLQEENSDLTKIVADLSRYIYHLKIAGEKTRELYKILGIYEQEIEDKVKQILGDNFQLEPPADDGGSGDSIKKKF